MPKLTIDGRVVEVEEGAYILQAARQAGVHIPTLCQFDGLEPWGGCRLCVVDLWRPGWDEDWFKLVTACNHPAEDGVKVFTSTPRVLETRRVVLDLLLARCDEIGVSAISSVNRGAGREIAPPFHQPPPDCIGCLACAEICPTSCIPFTSSDRGRRIWERDFEMLRCSRCGRAHITVAQADYWAGRNGVPRAYFETCDACKRLEHADVFARLSAGT
jgi:bidirectional [NiFe] hydrogenase diaphorase subunit